MDNNESSVKEIEIRKLEHIFLCSYCDVEYDKTTLLENVELVHRGTCGVNFNDIETEIKLFGKRLSAPIIVSGMTGGHSKAKEINKNIAKAVEELGLGMGVGSQRAAIVNEDLIETYSIVRDYTSNLVIGNLGAVNFIVDKWDEEIVDRAVEMIDADAMAIHFNPLQEIIQPEGDLNFKNMVKIKNVITNYKRKYKNIPFIAKQVGEGFSREDALILKEIGFDAIDIQGSGGTSWAKVEIYRVKDANTKKLLKKFSDWGIPTAASIFEVKSVYDRVVIGSGGIRSGLDIAKCIAIGCDCCSVALPILKASLKGWEEVVNVLENYIKELKIAMFLVGAENIIELKKTPYIIKGTLKDWIDR
ncbi:isopentenyl-diphosphate delta-isomerase, type 2 [Methanocaldococcus vulcanius M7]|uniref:Isopentenyl-diphosphate delta-isomerase n=1 Tax=Methanocaldococcus vulcanius (strain ATCC 700851 / DSM 12094 / M7) TaxID=579137 RepID=C9REZ4_METVM|nr:type 2 isopentenyl-diphosphate Delta-isomerase [Methanocaldococcus vulcanius]ACX72146.1 isopentenyl-diphosphate delta-isomerase, type 2 [Methanocaldococcus vulcanius M7]